MEWQHIQTLVEKYWAGETTLEEEALLRQHLSQPNVPENLRQEAQLLGFWQAEQTVTVSAARDVALRKVHVTQHGGSGTTLGRTIRFNPMWARIAATLVIGVGLYFWTTRTSEEPNPLAALAALNQESVEAEEAYDEVRDALLFISLTFKEGAKPVQNLQELEQLQSPMQKLQQLNRAQQPIEHLEKFNRAEEIIRNTNN